MQSAKSSFVEIQSAIEVQLAERIAVRNQKATLRLLLSVHDSVVKVEALLLITTSEDATGSPSKSTLRQNLAVSSHASRQAGAHKIERIAAEYNQMLYLIDKARDLEFINALTPVS